MTFDKAANVQTTYDAIVIGSGISGGWAAKELCEKGLKTLVLERGKLVRHQTDYKATEAPWSFSHRGWLTKQQQAAFPIQPKEGRYPIDESNVDFREVESLNPYIQEKPFDWYRGGSTGGKLLTWGRQVYRWSDLDFEANAREDIAIDWSIRYKDIAPWYSQVVSKILYDDKSGKASGVEIIDVLTKETHQYYAKVIFVNASTVSSTQILLNSTSERFPKGLGNDSDQLGRNLINHHSRVGASGKIEGFLDKTYFGRRANGIFSPRYQNMDKDKRNYLRGFDYQGGGYRNRGKNSDATFGQEFKKAQTEFGDWGFSLSGFGETLPYPENRLTLHPSEKDPFGIPQLVINVEIKENEIKMRVDMENDAGEMLESFGGKNVVTYQQKYPPLGLSKHELETARKGHDPKTSVLNKHNQVWGCENAFVTDGACMVSSNCVN